MNKGIITDYVCGLLEVDSFQDYCPNGLQVEGVDEVNTIVSAVSASLEAIEKAIELNADALLVHHGLFWKGDAQSVTGVLKNRLALLLKHNINLLAYHLPLDVHKVYGNNALFAKYMGFGVRGAFDLMGIKGLGWYGDLDESVTAMELKDMLAGKLGREPLALFANSDKIKRVSWCTGAAQDGITAAKEMGADAFISGEVSERTYYLAKELGIHYFAAGHHATETFGVKALGEHLAGKYSLKHSFVNAENPV